MSTVTTLNSVSTALPVPQYRAPVTVTPVSSPSVWQKPTASSKSLPGVRIVVDTVLPSSWMVIGSSTIRSSGERRAPSGVTVVTNTRRVRPRLIPSGYG